MEKTVSSRKRPKSSDNKNKKPNQPPIPDFAIVAVMIVVGIIVLVLLFLGVRALLAPAISNLTENEDDIAPQPSSILGDYANIGSMNFTEEFSRHEIAPYLPTPTPTPVSPLSIEGQSISTYASMVTVGDAGFDYYKYDQTLVDRFVEKLNSSINKISDDVDIFTMIVPSAIDIMLPLSFLHEYADYTSDQPKAITYINSVISSDAIKLDITPILKAYCDKKLYFHTHDTWTSLGAYYASATWKSANGFDTPVITSYDKKTVPNFQGYISKFIYGDSATYSEDVDYYVPMSEMFLTDPTSDDDEVKNLVFPDSSGNGSYYKNEVFMGKSEAIKEITNYDKEGEGTVVIVGDAYMYQFAPYVAEDYHKTYVVDYRMYEGNLSDLVDTVGAEDLLYLFRIGATVSDSWISNID